MTEQSLPEQPETVVQGTGDGVNGNTNEVPDAVESRKFWEKFWSVDTEHVKDAAWLGEVWKSMEHAKAMDDVSDFRGRCTACDTENEELEGTGP